ncbi:hypothetical protein [Clostridium tetani]|uniref:hypothetical protein n=1 Tax=Clostridium tetani TaxID=1513 RepID=UPI0013E98ACE|nr:hypothetical protein [Clostridium tetani]
MTEQLTVRDLKEFIKNLPDEMKVYITSTDDMPVRKLVDLSNEIRTGYYSDYI